VPVCCVTSVSACATVHAGHVIPGLIHKCYLAQKAGEPFTIMGTGKPLCARPGPSGVMLAWLHASPLVVGPELCLRRLKYQRCNRLWHTWAGEQASGWQQRSNTDQHTPLGARWPEQAVQ
jgi:hypothetical protein